MCVQPLQWLQSRARSGRAAAGRRERRRHVVGVHAVHDYVRTRERFVCEEEPCPVRIGVAERALPEHSGCAGMDDGGVLRRRQRGVSGSAGCTHNGVACTVEDTVDGVGDVDENARRDVGDAVASRVFFV